MTNTSVGIALVGCGRIAGHHARAIRDTPGLHLVAACDLNLEAAEQYGREFSVPVYSDYRVMLNAHPEIGIVAIMTPSGMHNEHAAEMLESYGKNVILEKPTVLKPSQLIGLASLARTRGLRIFPVFQNRHNMAVQRVRRGLEIGELGSLRILAVRVRWCRPQRYYDLSPWRGTFAMDGGALTNQGIHHIDLVRYLGGPVRRVCSSLSTLRAHIEVEDAAVGIIEFESGALGTLEITTAAEPSDFEASISLVCSDGLAQIGGIAVNELQTYTPDPQACLANSEDFSASVYGNGHGRIYAEVARCLSEGDEFSVAVSDAKSTLDLLNALYVSDEMQSWVDVSQGQESTRLGRPDEYLSDLYRTAHS